MKRERTTERACCTRIARPSPSFDFPEALEMPLSNRVLAVSALVAAVVSASSAPLQAEALIPLDQARARFAEAKRLCEADGGRLWSVPLGGPIMFVDPASRTFVASAGDSLGIAREQDGVFVGTLPADQNIANTAFIWAGVHWTQIMWPLPASAEDADALMAHELFHRLQAQLGFKIGNPENQHLDSVEGRTLLQLEWRALAVALVAKDAGPRKRAIADALAFRSARRRLVASAAAEEKDLELNEGLAEYTGMALATPQRAGRVAYALRVIDRTKAAPTFVRAFAYASGPAYGLLLDDSASPWRERTRHGEDLGALLAGAAEIQPPADDAGSVAARENRYDGPALRTSEQARADRKQAVTAGYRRRLVDGPTLRIALRHMNLQFDPRNQQPLGEAGTVYPTLRIADDWGILTVTGGALLASDWMSVTVAAPKDGATSGEGWTLELKPGWKLAPGARPGSYVVTQ
jgi:hypothetical protein